MSTPRKVATFAGSVGMEGDEDDEPMSSAAKPRHTCLGMVRALFEFPSFDLRLRMELQPRLSNRWALFQPTVTLIVDRSDHDVRTFTGRVRWAWTSEKVSAQLFSQPTAEDQRAFIDAVHSLVTLQHPNLLRVYGTSTSGRDIFVISPFLDTTDVLDRLIDCPSLERERVVLAVARAISYLHSRDETHGDINAYNVLMTRTNDVIVAGFGPLCRPVTLSAEPAATSNKPSWATVVDDLSGSEVEVESDASDDPDWQPPYRPRRNSDVPLESSLGDRVLHHMRSSTVEGDVFAFGFFIVQMFTGLAPCDSVDSLRLLRMVLNGQRPRHPGRSAEVRGLDEIHWQICQRCWSHSTTMDDIVAALEAPRPNVIRCPVRWDLVSLEAFAAHTAPTLTRQIRDVQKVRSGRDIECRWLEMHGILHGDSVRAVNLIPPHAYRRRLGKLGTEQAFLAEVVVWSQLRHAHILPLLGCYFGNLGSDDKECFVVPRMVGGTCVDYLRKCDNPERLRIVSEIADALHFLHSRSPHIIHGDVRGHSVFISGDGHAFLGNFDFTPLQFPLADFDDTDNYEIIQSVRWAAPEVINGSVPIGTRSDVFAFGLFGYEVFSGHVPFHETDPVSARRLLGKNQRPPRPETDQLSDEVWNLLQRCWRRVAPARPTMEQVSRRLQELRTQT